MRAVVRQVGRVGRVEVGRHAELVGARERGSQERPAHARALIANPEHEGIQLIARGDDGAPLGFATIYWMWSTSRAARIGIMNDLFTAPEARRQGVGEALISACLAAVRERGAAILQWQTAKDNFTAQALYEHVGGIREEWYDFYLEA